MTVYPLKYLHIPPHRADSLKNISWGELTFESPFVEAPWHGL